jgi:hypothetical protein
MSGQKYDTSGNDIHMEPVVGSCEHSNGPFGFIKYEEFHD